MVMESATPIPCLRRASVHASSQPCPRRAWARETEKWSALPYSRTWSSDSSARSWMPGRSSPLKS